MTMSHLIRPRMLAVGVLLTIAGCAEPPSAPVIGAVAARGSSSDPTVSSVLPVDAPQNFTVDLKVTGAGFDRGSAVRLERGGVPATTIVTNKTTFVSSTQLVANVTIQGGADPTLYDVAVTTSTGKRGIGVERFEVEDMLDLGMLAGGAQAEKGYRINNLGHVVGMAWPSDFFWTAETGAEALAPDISIIAHGINDADKVVATTCGTLFDPMAPPCAYYGVLLERVGAGVWTMTRVTGDNGETRHVTNTGQIYGNDPGPTRWTPGGAGFTKEAMPVPPTRPDAKIYFGNNTGQAAGGDVLWSFESNGWVTTLVPAPSGATSPGVSDIADIDAGGNLFVSGSAYVRGYQKPVRWTFRRSGGNWLATKIEVLPLPSKVTSGGAWGINTAGVAVGFALGTAAADPVMWSGAGTIQVLPHPSGKFQSRAQRINNTGQISGYLEYSNGNHAVIWQVP
jgi:hypothetical protein